MNAADLANGFHLVDTLPLRAQHRTIDLLLEETVGMADSFLKPPKALEMLPSLWLLVFDRPGKVMVVETAWQNEAEKSVMVGTLRRLVQLAEADRYSFMSETWIVRGDADDPLIKKRVAPRDNPNAIDGAAILAVDRQRAVARTFEIRQFADRRRIMALDDDMQPTGWTGRMFDLFKPINEKNRSAGGKRHG